MKNEEKDNGWYRGEGESATAIGGTDAALAEAWIKYRLWDQWDAITKRLMPGPLKNGKPFESDESYEPGEPEPPEFRSRTVQFFYEMFCWCMCGRNWGERADRLSIAADVMGINQHEDFRTLADGTRTATTCHTSLNKLSREFSKEFGIAAEWMRSPDAKEKLRRWAPKKRGRPQKKIVPLPEVMAKAA
jgi:hypothetical protein